MGGEWEGIMEYRHFFLLNIMLPIKEHKRYLWMVTQRIKGHLNVGSIKKIVRL